MQMPEQHLQRPLVLLVAAGRAEREIRIAVAADERRGERRARPLARARASSAAPPRARTSARACRGRSRARESPARPRASRRSASRRPCSPSGRRRRDARVAARRLADAGRDRRVADRASKPRLAAVGRPGRSSAGRLVADERAALVGVRRESSVSIGTSENAGSPYHASRSAKASFAHSVTVWMYSALRARRREVEALEQASCCRKTGAWLHGPAFSTSSRGSRRRAAARSAASSAEVGLGEQARVTLARAVHPLALLERDERLGDEAAVPGVAGGLDLRVAVRASAPRPRRRAAVRRGELPGCGAASRRRAGEIDLGGGRPLVAEQGLDVADRIRDRRQHRVAVLRVADRVPRTSRSDIVPWSRSRASQPPNAPGTTAASGPVPGTRSRPSVAVALDRRGPRRGPCPHSTTGSPPAGQRIAGRSPPGPFRCGSTTCSVKPAATAASKALPPCSSTAMPAAEASQWVEATMPKVPRSSGRVVNTNVSVRAERCTRARTRPRRAAAASRARRTAGRARNRFRLDAAEIPDAGAAVVHRVGVQHLAPVAADRHADAVLVARHGREVHDADERLLVAPRRAARTPGRCSRRVRHEPARSRGSKSTSHNAGFAR